MRSRLLIPLVAVLLLGALLYATLRPTKSPAAELSADGQTASAPKAPEQLSPDLSAAESREAVAPGPLESRPAVETNPDREMHPENDLVPLTDLASKEAPDTLDLDHTAEDQFFERKYAGRTEKERRAAIDRLRYFLDAHEAGIEEKGQVLTEDQVRAMRIEIGWIKGNLVPSKP